MASELGRLQRDGQREIDERLLGWRPDMPAAEEATAMPRTEIHPVAAADRGVALHNVLAAGDAA